MDLSTFSIVSTLKDKFLLSNWVETQEISDFLSSLCTDHKPSHKACGYSNLAYS